MEAEEAVIHICSYGIEAILSFLIKIGGVSKKADVIRIVPVECLLKIFFRMRSTGIHFRLQQNLVRCDPEVRNRIHCHGLRSAAQRFLRIFLSVEAGAAHRKIPGTFVGFFGLIGLFHDYLCTTKC